MDASAREPASAEAPVGVFIVGAHGAVATTVIVGAAALARGLASPVGLVTAHPRFDAAGLAPLADFVFGGAEVRPGTLLESARALAAEGVVPFALVEAVREDLAAADARIAPGVIGPRVNAEGSALRDGVEACAPRGAIARARAALRAFRAETGAREVVVVHLASVEPVCDEAEALATEEALESFLDRADPATPVSLLYAVAALDEGASYLNFTPAVGLSSPALQARAERLGLPHAGRDGKTGETLLKSVLAPMFAARQLRVLSWAGYNILGNRDGEALADDARRAAKLRSKAGVLRAVLGDEGLGTEHVEIAYVPSIGDWKTAWDHIHFEGFLGTRMALELTWRGCDSALAAPLVIDCVRLLARARETGRVGVLSELASFFKDPLGSREQAFPAQLALLDAFARELTEAAPVRQRP